MSFIPVSDRTEYGEPRVGDIVFHFDEPFTSCRGEVIEVNSDVFVVHWNDGQDESYDPDDHPDIFQ